MLKGIREVSNWTTRNGPFVVVTLSIFIAAVLAFYKGTDISSVLPTLVGLYLGSKATSSVSAHIAASRDETCSTAQVIREVEGLVPSKSDSDVKPPSQ